jgi:TBC1 domain family protein 5
MAPSYTKSRNWRNAQLSKLLEAAVSDLWDYQKIATERGEPSKTGEGSEAAASLEQLSVAIAKVQFVQVYLGDVSLPLPADHVAVDIDQEKEDLEDLATPLEKPRLKEAKGQACTSPASLQPRSEPETASRNETELADPSMFDDPDDENADIETLPKPTTPVKTIPATKIDSPPTIELPDTKAEEVPLDLPSPPATRPPLAESSYSWMLGSNEEKDRPDTDITAARKPPPSFFEDQRRNRGFLFGDEDAVKVEEPPLVVHKKGRAHRKHASSASKVVGDEVVLDLQDMRDKK